MNIITDSIKNEKEYSSLISAVFSETSSKNPHSISVTGLCEGARISLLMSVARDCRARFGRGILTIFPDEKNCAKMYSACRESGISAYIYPFRDFIFHNMTFSHELEYERIGVLSAILRGDYDIIITTPDAALQYTVPPGILASSGMRLSEGAEISTDRLSAYLSGSGYVRAEMVEGPGQFAIRGDIVDLYPPSSESPIRIQLFGDEIEVMEYFDILSQRRTGRLSAAELTPAREILAGAEERALLAETITQQLNRADDERVKDMLRSELEAVNSGRELNFLDKYISLIYPEKTCLLDYFDIRQPVAVTEYAASRDRIKAFEFRMREAIEGLISEAEIYGKSADYCKWGQDFENYISSVPSLICDAFVTNMSGKSRNLFSFMTKNTVSYANNAELLIDDLKSYRKNSFRTVLLCDNKKMAENTADLLSQNEISSVILPKENTGDSEKELTVITYGMRIPGYELTVSRFAALSLCEKGTPALSSGVRKSHRAMKKSAKERIMSYADLEPGDYVVHDIHGIGRYLGLESITHDGVTAEYVKISYDENALLYIPTDKLDLLSKYIGARAEDGSVRLSRLGGKDWEMAKSRAIKATKEMARELIQLYAERQRRPGFAFPSDDEMQRQFESAFEYEETDGQNSAVEEIKRDMEAPWPMERLLCGDVGFGKTEVALRAAFKAVSAGKQVAILVPTTILAMQHYQTILSRMRGFPIHADMISRFRTKAEQAETLRRLRRGELDIIVGTHRIIGRDIVFKDLGLLIIDEEQRFGVAQKEKLKQIAKNVDVLTLTATPIPRTLNMAMSGIRDMSILEEAPGDRLPVQTYVLEYDDVILSDAIKKELHRGGQVFWLHNRVESIEAAVAHVHEMVPEAKIAYAHGQMDREQISEIWSSLIMGETDVLISTTIIETGVDIPNANTLIIEHADKMGLAQLHQIRGRIGRSSRRAYAYFTYPRGTVLSDIAEKRLEAIRDYSEFGSGFKIAMRDLELRGAGNLLGSEQHGQIDSVGYNLYMKLLSDAILEEKGEKRPEKPVCKVSLQFDAYLPESYIRNQAQRIDAYKKIALIETKEDYSDILDELSDRYGKPPRAAENLLKISYIRSASSMCDIDSVEQRENSVLISSSKLNISIWVELAHEYNGKLLLNLSSSPYVSYRIRKGTDTLDFLCELFAKYIQINEEKSLNIGAN